jgi:hypothetical protein
MRKVLFRELLPRVVLAGAQDLRLPATTLLPVHGCAQRKRKSFVVFHIQVPAAFQNNTCNSALASSSANLVSKRSQNLFVGVSLPAVEQPFLTRKCKWPY